MNLRVSILAAAIIGCAPSQPLGSSEQLPGAMAAAPNCTFALSGKTSNVTNTQLAACAVLICSLNPAGCVNTPNPIPPSTAPGTGGALSTGGRASTGGKAATGGLGAAGGASSTPGTLSSCQTYCAKVKELGCNVDPATCVSLCGLHTTDLRFTQSTACIMTQTSKAATQNACGALACP